MAEEYVTKEQFNELVIKYNNLCEKLSELNLKQTVSFDDSLFDSDEDDFEDDVSDDDSIEDNVIGGDNDGSTF